MTSKVLVVEHEADAPPALLGRWLEEAGARARGLPPLRRRQPPRSDVVRRPAGPGRCDGRQRRRGVLLDRPDQGPARPGGAGAGADPGPLPRAPAALGGAGRHGHGRTPRATRSGIHRIGWTAEAAGRPAGRAARPQRHQRGRGALELRRGRRAAPGQRGRWPAPTGARCRRFGTPPGHGACSGTPRSTSRSRGRGPTATTRTSSSGGSTGRACSPRSDASEHELDHGLGAAGRHLPGRRRPAGVVSRADSWTGRAGLLALGFHDIDSARASLAELGAAAEPLLAFLGRAADPDLALAGLVRLAHACDDELLDALVRDEGTAMRLLSVLGASQALGDHLVRHPAHWHELTDPSLGSTRPAAYAVRAGLLRAVGADPADPMPTASCPTPRRSTPCAWSTAGSCCAWPHATSPITSASTTRPPSSPTSRARRWTPRSPWLGSGSARRRRTPGSRWSRWASAAATSSTTSPTSTSSSWPSRPASRTAGTSRPRCAPRRSWPRTWCGSAASTPPRARSGRSTPRCVPRARQDRSCAPSPAIVATTSGGPRRGSSRHCSRPARSPATCELGAAFVEMVSPHVWSAAEREGFVVDVQAMRRRVLDHIPAREAERQLKLGSGGLRDVEFAVQLLQLVHGRADESLRGAATLSALAALTAGRLRRPRGRRRHARRLRVAAHARAPHPALPAPAYPRRAERRGVAAPAGPVDGLQQGPRRVAGEGVGASPPRGPPAPREAVLPPAAGRGRPDPRRGGEALPAGRRVAAGGARVRRPEGGAAPPRGAHDRRDPDRADPEDAPARAAGVVRRRARPGRGPLRVPPDQRGAGPHAVVSQDAPRRGPGGRAPGPAAGDVSLRHRPARSASRRASGCWGRTCSRSPPRR